MYSDTNTESAARLLSQIWETHRTPAFAKYLLKKFGREPLSPAEFKGIFLMQMIGGYFFPNLPAGPGPIVERIWLVDDFGFRISSMDELHPVENEEGDNYLVANKHDNFLHDSTDIGQSYLFSYPRYKFCVINNKITYYEQFGATTGRLATCENS